MKNLVLYFQFLVINTKNFMIFQLQIYLQIFAFSTDFTLQKKILITIENFSVFVLQPYKKIDSVENWFCVKIAVFPSFFFLLFSIFLKTVGKCLLFTSIMHQGYSLFHRKPPPKFEIEALFRLVMLYTDTKTKKHTSFGALYCVFYLLNISIFKESIHVCIVMIRCEELNVEKNIFKEEIDVHRVKFECSRRYTFNILYTSDTTYRPVSALDFAIRVAQDNGRRRCIMTESCICDLTFMYLNLIPIPCNFLTLVVDLKQYFPLCFLTLCTYIELRRKTGKSGLASRSQVDSMTNSNLFSEFLSLYCINRFIRENLLTAVCPVTETLPPPYPA
ncbi:hypothetical protein AGLY_009284 [Aphis glycines]|uniref:Uncharacterized protein n=1 Tax=Aphis glycines TaxID=307491 RepID=A0A6G0TK50_APHGL|nr:hypothetical protein AGLY_009284 [Aphis glycines]